MSLLCRFELNDDTWNCHIVPKCADACECLKTLRVVNKLFRDMVDDAVLRVIDRGHGDSEPLQRVLGKKLFFVDVHMTSLGAKCARKIASDWIVLAFLARIRRRGTVWSKMALYSDLTNLFGKGAKNKGESPFLYILDKMQQVDWRYPLRAVMGHSVKHSSQTKQRIRQDTLRAIRTRDKWVDELCDRLLHALTKYSTDASMRWVTREKLHAIVHSSMHNTSMDAERTKVLQNSESLRADI